MPKDFDDCQKGGGRIISVKGPSKQYALKHGEYRHVCILKGKFHLGEIKDEKTDEETRSEEEHAPEKKSDHKEVKDKMKERFKKPAARSAGLPVQQEGNGTVANGRGGNN
jgi:hypothetical protein